MQKRKPLQWMIRVSKKQLWKMWLLVFCNVFFSVLSVAFAFAIRHIINGATLENRTVGKNMIIWGAVAIFIIVLLQLLFRILIGSLAEHLRGRLEISFKSHVFNTVLSRKYQKISTYHSGELLNRLTSDVSVVCEGATTILPSVISAVARLICAVVALVVLDWVFALAFIVAGMLVFLTIAIMRGKLKSLHKKAQQTEGKSRSFMQECIENLLAVKTFSVNSKIEDKSLGLQEDNFRVKMKRKTYSVLGHSIYNFIFSAGYLFALIYGAARLWIDPLGFLYGDLSAILQLVNNVQVPFASLSNIFPTYYAMIASAERLMELDDIEAEDEENAAIEASISRGANAENIIDKVCFNAKDFKLKKYSIVMDGISFAYGSDDVLSNVDLTVNNGDFIAVLGQSGIGKSTLIKLLLGVYPVGSGSMYIETQGKKIPLSTATRTLFAYVPQGNLLFSGTLRDNVTFACGSATEEQIDSALEISCAKPFVSTLPDGLDTVVGENGAGLSEGQIQRIAIARAILCGAPVLLLDEATSALDDGTERELLNNLKGLKGVTVVIVSHRKQVLSVCNRSVTLTNKKLTEN